LSEGEQGDDRADGDVGRIPERGEGDQRPHHGKENRYWRASARQERERDPGGDEDAEHVQLALIVLWRAESSGSEHRHRQHEGGERPEDVDGGLAAQRPAHQNVSLRSRDPSRLGQLLHGQDGTPPAPTRNPTPE
jgi:hypothetical protein